MIWAVADNGWIYEARLTNVGQTEYHGYPVRDSEPIAEPVYRRFAEWAHTSGDQGACLAAENCKTSLWIRVMENFEITVASDSFTSWDDPQPISLRSGDVCFTRLLRDDSNALADHLHAPPIQLAFWLIDNWWRLRWEPVVPEEVSPEWRLAHELSAIGGGYVWPGLRIWGDDTRVGLSSHGDSPQGMSFAVQYLTNTSDSF